VMGRHHMIGRGGDGGEEAKEKEPRRRMGIMIMTVTLLVSGVYHARI
jgi:hypothetical protein